MSSQGDQVVVDSVVHGSSVPPGLAPLIIRIGRREYELAKPPSEQSVKFLRASEREQLFGGAKSGSKSVTLCQKIGCLAALHPGNQLGIFRQDMTDLRDSTLTTWDWVMPPDLILDHHKTHHYYLVRTSGKPSKVLYGGLQDMNTEDGRHEESAKGKEFGEFGIDEPSEIAPENYRQLKGQLRWQLPSGARPPYMALLTSNPEPGWVRDTFWSLIEPTEQDQSVKYVSDGRRVFIKALPSDNPYNPPNYVEEQSQDNPAEWVRKYMRGSWATSTGQVFKEADEHIHLIDMPPEPYLSALILVASIDHADTGVTDMVIEGIDPDGNTVSLLEYREKNKLISEHARGMRALMREAARMCGKSELVNSAPLNNGICPEMAAFEYCLIDPSTRARVLQSRTELYSRQQEYANNGIPTIPGINALEAGINLMAEYLHVKPQHRHPFTGQMGSPSTFITNRCRGLWRDLIGLRRVYTAKGTPQYLGEDHGLDNKRYILMSRPQLPKRTKSDVLSLSTHDQMALRAHEKWAARFGKGAIDNRWFGDTF